MWTVLMVTMAMLTVMLLPAVIAVLVSLVDGVELAVLATSAKLGGYEVWSRQG